MSSSKTRTWLILGMFLLCLGYFASYVPYTVLTKMATKGLFDGMAGTQYEKGIANWSIQPIMALATFIAMFSFISIAGWWKHARKHVFCGISMPWPHWFTLISGICTAGQILTTTLAYTYKESIVFAMLLMRGGVLIMAPWIDKYITSYVTGKKRKITWPAVIALLLSLGALIVAFAEKASTIITVACLIDVSIYLVVYFFRFVFMAKYAKVEEEKAKVEVGTEKQDINKMFFVEEQFVANPVLFFGLLIMGIVGIFTGPQSVAREVWTGFTIIPFSGYFWPLFAAGACSYGAGLFGTLIYLDPRAMTFCVPANRISSIFAGIVATSWLFLAFEEISKEKGINPVSDGEWIGVALVTMAMIFLAFGQNIANWLANIRFDGRKISDAEFHNRQNP